MSYETVAAVQQKRKKKDGRWKKEESKRKKRRKEEGREERRGEGKGRKGRPFLSRASLPHAFKGAKSHKAENTKKSILV